MKRALALLLTATILAACAPAAEPTTAERQGNNVPPKAANKAEFVADYMQHYGGNDGQYEIIYDADCDALENLLNSAAANVADDVEGSDEWHAHLGYGNAANERMLDKGC